MFDKRTKVRAEGTGYFNNIMRMSVTDLVRVWGSFEYSFYGVVIGRMKGISGKEKIGIVIIFCGVQKEN